MIANKPIWEIKSNHKNTQSKGKQKRKWEQRKDGTNRKQVPR